MAHVDEWLEEAEAPDTITDSWVARTRRAGRLVTSSCNEFFSQWRKHI